MQHVQVGSGVPWTPLQYHTLLLSVIPHQAPLVVQVEGAWVFGMGLMLQERVDYTPQGQPLYNSTWTYKIPAASCIPRIFNIALLAVSTSA